MKLTERQYLILERLSRRSKKEIEMPESGIEMADALWTRGCFTSLEQGQRSAQQLVAKGLAKKVGFTASGAQCFEATERGLNLFRYSQEDAE